MAQDQHQASRLRSTRADAIRGHRRADRVREQRSGEDGFGVVHRARTTRVHRTHAGSDQAECNGERRRSTMTGLPGNLGNIDINALIELFKKARDTGKSVLQEALKALANDPRLKGIVDQLQNLFGKPVIELTDEELTNLIGSWHKGLSAKSKDMVDEPTPPPPPPPPATGILDS